MKYRCAAFLLAFLVGFLSIDICLADSAADQDTTPVSQCEDLPPSVSIAVMSWSDTTKVCREMARVLEGIRRKDITNFEKAIYVLQAKGYEGDNVQIAKDLVEIIRLRGLYDKPDRWYDTNDLVVRMWTTFNGAIGPHEIIAFLRSSPDAAKNLSDDGLVNMLIVMKRLHQSGSD